MNGTEALLSPPGQRVHTVHMIGPTVGRSRLGWKGEGRCAEGTVFISCISVRRMGKIQVVVNRWHR